MHKALALALDLGGTKVDAALVDSRGHIMAETRFRAPTGSSSSSDQLADSVRNVVMATVRAAPTGTEIVGVGIGAAGPIQRDEGLVSPLNLPAWRNFGLTALVAECVPEVAITLRVDGLCIALAEHWIGAARGAQNLMGMVVSTGIGGGLILGGRAVPGPTGNAGHIGHIDVGGADDACACGGHGCLEAVASGPRSVAWARAQGWVGSNGEDLAVSYGAGDPIARATIERSGRAIGKAIGSATALLDLDIVTLGGGFSRVTPDLFRFIQLALGERSAFEYVQKVRVLPSALSEDGPLVGAAALIHRAEILD